MNLPTKITVSRIVATVLLLITLFVLYLIPGITSPMLGDSGINVVFLVIFIFFLIASYTDHLDGKLARKNNQVTDLGKFLDPIADKLLVNSMLIFLAIPGLYQGYASQQLPLMSAWCVILMVARDIVIDALRQIAATKGIVVSANIFGKAKTVTQMVAICLVLLNDFPFSYIYKDKGIDPRLTVTAFVVYIATAISVISGIIYVIQNKKVFAK